MKIVLFCFTMVVLYRCLGPTEHQLVKTQQNSNKITAFEYTSTSRGRYLKIEASDKAFYISKTKTNKPIKKLFSVDTWRTLLLASDTISIENLSNLKAPSKTHQFDGAPLARLKITSKGQTYESVAFDHGNPPQEIAVLVNHLLSIAENVE